MTRSVMGALPRLYSFGTAGTYADAAKVTAYVDGVRVWDIEP